MFQTILIEFLKDVPLLAILLIVLYFIYRELKQTDEKILKEMRESDERILKEMRESDERILKEMRTTFERFKVITFGIQETNMALLSSKKVIDEKEYNFIKTITNSFLKMSSSPVNPLTDEEKERILYLMNKKPNELTHEEALELYNLSFKIIDEFGDKYIEAYLFFHYACLMKYKTLQGSPEKE